MYAVVEAIKRKYRAKTPDNWPMKGDVVHFTDKYNGRQYTGRVLEWERMGNRIQADIFWRVELINGDILGCELEEITSVERSRENGLKLLREEG